MVFCELLCIFSIILYSFRLLEKEDIDIYYVFICKCIIVYVKLIFSMIFLFFRFNCILVFCGIFINKIIFRK